MTVTAVPSNDRIERFAAASGQTVFTYDFPIFAANQLQVRRVRAGVEAVLTFGADYTVTGAGTNGGGTVILTTASLPGDTIVILSNVPYSRSALLTEGGNFTAAGFEAEGNRQMALNQQLLRDIAGALRLSPSEGGIPPLPLRAVRANRLLGFDSAGNPTTFATDEDASTDLVTAAGSLTARSLAERFADALHLRDFGAVGDGVTNDTAAIDAWIAAVLSTGKPGYFGVGHYKYVGTQFLMIIGGLAATQGGKLLGAGYARTILDVTACTGTPQFLVRCQANFLFGWTFDGFEVRGNREGVMAQWARDWDGSTYPDSFNSCRFTDLVFRNNGVTDNAIAVRFNSVLESEFHTVANCNNNAQLLGIATDLQGVGFSKGKITGGNARYAMRIARYTFGNEFNGELAVCQCPILLDCPSGWNKVGGNLGWGQPNANPALSGINGVGFAVEALVAGGPLYLARETIYGQAGAPLVTGAAKANVVALGYGQGTTVSQSLRLQPTSAADSPTILQLAAAGRAAETQYYRDGSPAALRWTFGMGADNTFALNRYNSSSVFQDTPFYIDASTGQFVVNRLLVLQPLRPPEYLKANLPSPSVRGFCFVIDEAGGFVPAFSDGANWRRVTDGAIVS